ncbi:MAG: hypothetical protein HZA74_01250 [Ignavibacteriales bacterium]|nr:hypothetical protein [Ignavibacteriales bacterium]
MKQNIFNIYHKEELIAIVIRNNFQSDGIKFFTPDSFPQQLGYMNRKSGYKIQPHIHNPVVREVIWTQEVIFIKSGKVRVDFYDKDKNYLKSIILNKGDFILLAAAGHGFVMLENSEIIEIKQGPFCADKDKFRFESVDDDKIRYENE